MGGITDNRIDWIVPATPAEESKLTTSELAEIERKRQKAVADSILGSTSGLAIEDSGRDPYNSLGRRPR
jgi:hypothetical protein